MHAKLKLHQWNNIKFIVDHDKKFENWRRFANLLVEGVEEQSNVVWELGADALGGWIGGSIETGIGGGSVEAVGISEAGACPRHGHRHRRLVFSLFFLQICKSFERETEDSETIGLWAWPFYRLLGFLL